MRTVKLIVAVTFAAVLAGCVVYPVGGYGGGYYGRPHHHDGYYRR